MPKKWYLLGIPLGGILFLLLGALLFGGFNAALEATNTEEFCISCHEMEQFAFAEYKESVHYQPASGVSASCPDCHVPKAYLPKLARKVEATRELWHKLLGTINTADKYELHRATMAERVWAQMQATDSRECRSCHNVARMDLSKQSAIAARMHNPAFLAETQSTCIDCHKGVAHKLPRNSL